MSYCVLVSAWLANLSIRGAAKGLVMVLFCCLFFRRMYFKVKPDCQLAWSLAEQSADGTGGYKVQSSESKVQCVVFFGSFSTFGLIRGTQ